MWTCFTHISFLFSLTDDEGVLKDTSVVRMFLMMHPWYISSTNFAKKLLLKYPLLHHKDKNNTFSLDYCTLWWLYTYIMYGLFKKENDVF